MDANESIARAFNLWVIPYTVEKELPQRVRKITWWVLYSLIRLGMTRAYKNLYTWDNRWLKEALP